MQIACFLQHGAALQGPIIRRIKPIVPATDKPLPVDSPRGDIVLAADDKARELCDRPAWIRGIDHRSDAHTLGVRGLTTSMSARIAAEKL